MIHFYSSHSREYIKTGNWNAASNLIWPSSIDLELGKIPKEIDEYCEHLQLLSIEDPKDYNEIKRNLNLLENIDLSNASTLTIASVLALRLKFGTFKDYESASAVKDQREFLAFYNNYVGPCWDAFSKIFQFTSIRFFSELNFFEKYVGRFVHFFQSYQLMTKRTRRNLNHSKNILTLMSSSLIKFIASVPPESIGKFYTVPKMIREIALSMRMLYPKSKQLEDIVLVIITMSYDYLNCLEIPEFKHHLVNMLFYGRRILLDKFFEDDFPIELSSPLQELLLERELTDLLQDSARCSIINSIGSLSTKKAYTEKNILHLKFIIANEVRRGHFIVLIFRGKTFVKQISGNQFKIAKLIEKAIDASNRGEDCSLGLWNTLAEEIGLLNIGGDIFRLTKGIIISRLNIYPDGYFWNVPWQYLVCKSWSKIQKSFKPSLKKPPLVVVKLGARTTDTKFEAQRGVFLCGWNYNFESVIRKELIRRGELRDESLPNLPGAKKEVESLYSLWKGYGKEADIYKNCNADYLLTRVQQSAASTILHVACHGTSYPGKVAALLFPGKDPNSKYSALHYERILRVSWKKCEFVFFNACFGATGEPFVGGPSLGLHEALSIAGTKRVLAPLWPVLDKFAQDFAKTFYQELNKREDYLEAFTYAYRKWMSSSNKKILLSLASYNFVLL